MKYAKNSPIIEGAKDFCYVSAFNVDKIRKQITAQISFVNHLSDGTCSISFADYTITNIEEMIIDPEWNEFSSPPKPSNFDPLNPLTWESLAWDELPRVLNKQKLYFDRVLDEVEKGQTYEKVILEFLIELGKITSFQEGEFIP